MDKFRKGRRKKVTDRPCKACRERKRLEEEEAIKVRKAEKKQRAEAAKAAQSQQEQASRATTRSDCLMGRSSRLFTMQLGRSGVAP